MILADKIIALRKKEGMTQEDLANQIGVSRQSVSKWESSMAMPDLDKIIKLSNIFEVSTDFLLNDDLGMDQIIVDEKASETSKTIDVDFLNKYFEGYEKIAKYVALSSGLIIASPIVYMGLDGINESLAIIAFLAVAALAVGLFINAGFTANKYEFIEKEPYNFSYGVEGIIEKNISEYEPVFKRNIILAVALFILSPAIYVLMDKEPIPNDIPVFIFLILIAIASSLVGYTGVIYSSYKDVLKYRDPQLQRKERNLSKASGILWMSAIGVYLIYSFVTGNWHNSWVVFVIATIIQIALAIFFD